MIERQPTNFSIDKRVKESDRKFLFKLFETKSFHCGSGLSISGSHRRVTIRDMNVVE